MRVIGDHSREIAVFVDVEGESEKSSFIECFVDGVVGQPVLSSAHSFGTVINTLEWDVDFIEASENVVWRDVIVHHSVGVYLGVIVFL